VADRAKRCIRRVRRIAPAARWRRWAAGLASVRRRAAIGRSRPALVLAVRPPGRVAARRASWTFAPQVRLSMAVLLSATVREIRAAPGVIVRLVPTPPPVSRVAARRAWEPARRGRAAPIPAPAASAGAPNRARPLVVGRGPNGPRLRVAPAGAPPPTQARPPPAAPPPPAPPPPPPAGAPAPPPPP